MATKSYAERFQAMIADSPNDQIRLELGWLAAKWGLVSQTGTSLSDMLTHPDDAQPGAAPAGE